MSDHPFTYDRWATPDDPEFGVVRVDDLRKIERACLGIWAIARIVGNIAHELEVKGDQPLAGYIVSNLMGGVESLCDQLSSLGETAFRGNEPDFEPANIARPSSK